MMLVMAPTDPHCTIRTKIYTKAVHVTSMAECSRRYRTNKKIRILVGTVLEVEIGQKATALGMRRTFVVAKCDLGGGDMKVATINISIVKPHTPEPLFPTTGGDGGERASATTTTTNGNKTVTDPVTVQIFKAPASDPLNDESFKVVVSQPMAETPGRLLSLLTESGGSVVGVVLAHVMDAYTVDMPLLPRLLPLPQNIPVPIPPPPLSPMLSSRTPSPQRSYPG